MNREDWMLISAVVLILTLLMFAWLYIANYKYKECTKVGHTKLYCFLIL